MSAATAPTASSTLSLHDALPIYLLEPVSVAQDPHPLGRQRHLELAIEGDPELIHHLGDRVTDRKSTRLNSSHLVISYAVFCLKKKNYMIHDAQHTAQHVNVGLEP